VHVYVPLMSVETWPYAQSKQYTWFAYNVTEKPLHVVEHLSWYTNCGQLVTQVVPLLKLNSGQDCDRSVPALNEESYDTAIEL
jgi:hypothetical protein